MINTYHLNISSNKSARSRTAFRGIQRHRCTNDRNKATFCGASKFTSISGSSNQAARFDCRRFVSLCKLRKCDDSPESESVCIGIPFIIPVIGVVDINKYGNSVEIHVFETNVFA